MSTHDPEWLDEQRAAIEATDRQLLALLQQRARQVRKLWRCKCASGYALCNAERERALFRRWLLWSGAGEISADELKAVFAAVLAATRPADDGGPDRPGSGPVTSNLEAGAGERSRPACTDPCDTAAGDAGGTAVASASAAAAQQARRQSGAD